MSTVMPQIQIIQKTGTNFNLATDSSCEKYQTVSIKFKVYIYQLAANIILTQRSLYQIRHCLTRYIHIWHHFFNKKKLKYFIEFQNQNLSVL